MSNAMLTPIETVYRGCRFRSRLEAPFETFHRDERLISLITNKLIGNCRPISPFLTRPFALVEPHASFTLTSRHSHDADGDAAIHAATSAKASIMTTLILEEMHQLDAGAFFMFRAPL
jgi:hypothetical protein